LQLNTSKITGKALVTSTALSLVAYMKMNMVNLKCVALFLQIEKPGQRKITLVNRIVAHLTEHALDAIVGAVVEMPGHIQQNAGELADQADDDESGTRNQYNLPLGNADSPLVFTSEDEGEISADAGK
jgi:hypothetical protein